MKGDGLRKSIMETKVLWTAPTIRPGRHPHLILVNSDVVKVFPLRTVTQRCATDIQL